MGDGEKAAALRVLTASTFGMMFGYSAIGVASFGVFVLPLSQTFGWGRGDISVAATLMSLTMIAVAPISGVLIDRVGVRRIIIPSTVLFGLILASLALLGGQLWQLYLTYFLIAVVGVGTSPLTYSRIILAWFDARRGLALGIALAGVGIGAALVPIFVRAMTAAYSWQAGYLGLAALVLFVSLPFVAAWVREPDAAQSEALAQTPSGFTFAEALRSRALLLMGGSFVLLGVFTGGILAHLVPLLVDRGVDQTTAALVASVMGVALIVGRLVTGFLLDRFHAPIVVAVLLMGPVTGFGVLLAGAPLELLIVAVLLIGLGMGAEMDFISYLVSRYLGLRSFGRTYGILYAALYVGISLGPVLMGYSHQLSGDYDLALLVTLVATILAIPPFLFLGPYPKFARLDAVP